MCNCGPLKKREHKYEAVGGELILNVVDLTVLNISTFLWNNNIPVFTLLMALLE